MQKSINYIIVILIILMMYFLLIIAINHQEFKECHQWQQQAEQFPDFYLTAWQSEQCQAHNIIINK